MIDLLKAIAISCISVVLAVGALAMMCVVYKFIKSKWNKKK